MRAPSGMPALPRKLLRPGELLPQWEPGHAQSLLVTVQFCHSVYHVGAWAWGGMHPWSLTETDEYLSEELQNITLSIG